MRKGNQERLFFEEVVFVCVYTEKQKLELLKISVLKQQNMYKFFQNASFSHLRRLIIFRKIEIHYLNMSNLLVYPLPFIFPLLFLLQKWINKK